MSSNKRGKALRAVFQNWETEWAILQNRRDLPRWLRLYIRFVTWRHRK